MSTDEQPLVLSSTACTACGNEHRHAPDCQYNWHNATVVQDQDAFYVHVSEEDSAEIVGPFASLAAAEAAADAYEEQS